MKPIDDPASPLDKSFVLITAAAGGLGKALAAECASRGWNLFLSDIRLDLLEPLAEGMRRMYGVEVISQGADLTSDQERDALWQTIDRLGLCFHFLINVAGMEYEGLFTERSVDELRTILRLNVETGVEMTSQALRRRVKDSRFYILNISSMAGFYPMPVKAIYAATKRFIIDYSLALRTELRSEGVSVTVLCPSGMPTSERSIRGLQRQGIIGQFVMADVGHVAYRAIQKTLAGQAIYIPGVVNRWLHFISGFLPVTWKTAFIWKRWTGTRQKQSAAEALTSIKKSGDNPLTYR